MRGWRRHALPWFAGFGFLVIWQLACWIGGVPDFIFPGPVDTAKALIANWPGIWVNAAQTLETTLLGFAFAVAVGLSLGLIVGAVPAIYGMLNPIMIGFNTVPKVALVPLLVMWFGLGDVPAVVTAFLTSFFPIVVNVATGIATVEPELEDVLRSLGASRLDILLKVGMPRALPYFFASLKVASTLAFIGSVIAETVASNSGIGYLMMSASTSFRAPLAFAGLFVIAAMGIVVYGAAALIERRMTFWAVRGAHQAAFTPGG